MRKLLIIPLLAGAAFVIAQTAKYPDSVATDADLLVAKNRVQTTISASITSSAVTIPVESATGIVVNMALTLGTSTTAEIVRVNAINGLNLTVTRAYDGTTARFWPKGTSLQGYIPAWAHNALRAEIKAIEFALYNGTYPGTVNWWANVVQKPFVDVREYGAVGNGTTDDTAAFVAALATGKPVMVPATSSCYKITAGVDLPEGGTLFSDAFTNRWYAAGMTSARAKICAYVTNGFAFRITNPGETDYEGFNFYGIEVDGTNSTGTSDGILLDDVSSASYAISKIRFSNSTIKDFPRYQAHLKGTIYDVTFQRVSFSDFTARSGDYLVYTAGDGGLDNSELTFDDCHFAQYKDGGWAVKIKKTNSARFTNGSVIAMSAVGSSGIWMDTGGLSIHGTHLEGLVKAGTRGVRYVGSIGATIFPGALIGWDYGVEIGDPADLTANALGAVIGGGFLSNTTKDLWVRAGGDRSRTILLGTGGTPKVQDDRLSIDGASNLVNLAELDFAAYNVQVRSIRSNSGVLAIQGADSVATRVNVTATAAQATTELQCWRNAAGVTLVCIDANGSLVSSGSSTSAVYLPLGNGTFQDLFLTATGSGIFKNSGFALYMRGPAGGGVIVQTPDTTTTNLVLEQRAAQTNPVLDVVPNGGGIGFKVFGDGTPLFGVNAAGAGTPTLGANSPAVSATPYTWVKIKVSDGSTAYIPAWK